MKPPAFDYARPRTITEALAALAAHGGDAKILAGGQSLVPMLNFRLLSPKVLVDINGIAELDFLHDDPRGGLRIGALTRHHRLMTAATVRSRFPMLSEAMRHVAHLAIRNRGTIGGSLCHADPAAELPLMAVLLDATLRLAGPGTTRDVAADGFFTGALTTAIDEGELLTEIILPSPIHSGWGFREFSRRAGDFALAAVGVMLNVSGGLVADVRLAVMGIGETPFRIPEAEAVLTGRSVNPSTIAEACEAVRTAIVPRGDLHGSAAYRRHLVGGLAGQALADAWRRARARSDRPT